MIRAKSGSGSRVHGRILAAFGRRCDARTGQSRNAQHQDKAGHPHEIRPPGDCAPRHHVRARRPGPGHGSRHATSRSCSSRSTRTSKAVYAANLGLTEEESAKFWPIYNEYEAKVKPLQDRFLANINTFAEKYDTLTDADAAAILKEKMAIEKEREALKQKYTARDREGAAGQEGAALCAARDPHPDPDRAQRVQPASRSRAESPDRTPQETHMKKILIAFAALAAFGAAEAVARPERPRRHAAAHQPDPDRQARRRAVDAAADRRAGRRVHADLRRVPGRDEGRHDARLGRDQQVRRELRLDDRRRGQGHHEGVLQGP